VRSMKNLKQNPSKAEEMAFFDELCEQIPAGSYLSSLFTPALSNFVMEAIKNDHLPDVMDYLQGMEKRIGTLEAVITEQGETIRVREARINGLMIDLQGLREECTKFQAARAHEAGRVEEMKEALEFSRLRGDYLKELLLGLTSENPETVEETRETIRKVQSVGGLL
jgi:hypothetical protein